MFISFLHYSFNSHYSKLLLDNSGNNLHVSAITNILYLNICCVRHIRYLNTTDDYNSTPATTLSM